MTLEPDRNFKSFCDESNRTVADELFAPDNPSEWDDVVKVSHCEGFTFRNCIINPEGGNREDGVDVMRKSRHVEFYNCRVGAGNRYAFTIKGGSEMISLVNVTITGRRGKEGVDIDIGNFSHTLPNVKTGLVYLDNVSRANGEAVRVRVGWAPNPSVVGGNVKILFWASIGLKLYVLFKRLCSTITRRL